MTLVSKERLAWRIELSNCPPMNWHVKGKLARRELLSLSFEAAVETLAWLLLCWRVRTLLLRLAIETPSSWLGLVLWLLKEKLGTVLGLVLWLLEVELETIAVEILIW